MSKEQEYPPMELLRETSSVYPQAWTQMEDFHNANGKGDIPGWPSWCYAPMAAAHAVATHGIPVEMVQDPILAARVSQIIAALAPWRLNKEVYVFDQDLAYALYEQEGELDIPGDFLTNLPYTCFYVETPGLAMDEVPVHGFFVHLEYDINTKERELRFLFVPHNIDYVVGFPVHLDAGTLEDSMIATMLESVKSATDTGRGELLRLAVAANEQAHQVNGILKRALQLVLYILAENAEITEDPKQATITRRGRVVRDQYREIRKWNVGFRTGAALRAHEANEERSKNASTNGRMSPRPHLRRGHWHHFWTGQKATPEERKLILRWVSPIAVGTPEEDSPVTFHKAKGDPDENPT